MVEIKAVHFEIRHKEFRRLLVSPLLLLCRNEESDGCSRDDQNYNTNN